MPIAIPAFVALRLFSRHAAKNGLASLRGFAGLVISKFSVKWRINSKTLKSVRGLPVQFDTGHANSISPMNIDHSDE
jgi:hypothetical protein